MPGSGPVGHSYGKSGVFGMSDWQDWLRKSRTSEAQLHAEPADDMAASVGPGRSFQTGRALPPAWRWLYFHDLVKASDLGSDGHPALGISMPPAPLPLRMW